MKSNDSREKKAGPKGVARAGREAKGDLTIELMS